MAAFQQQQSTIADHLRSIVVLVEAFVQEADGMSRTGPDGSDGSVQAHTQYAGVPLPQAGRCRRSCSRP